MNTLPETGTSAPRRSWLLSTFLALGLLGAVFPANAAEQKIAVIDLRKVFDDYFKTRAADALLKERAAELEKERKNYMDQYQKLTDDYKKALDDANSQAISADEREKRKKTAEGKLVEIRELEQTVNQFDRTARGNLDEQQRQAREKILGEIRSVISQKAKAGSFTLVIDSAAESVNKTPILLYNESKDDLTQGVLEQLNATAPPGSLKPADKPADKPEKK